MKTEMVAGATRSHLGEKMRTRRGRGATLAGRRTLTLELQARALFWELDWEEAHRRRFTAEI